MNEESVSEAAVQSTPIVAPAGATLDAGKRAWHLGDDQLAYMADGR